LFCNSKKCVLVGMFPVHALVNAYPTPSSVQNRRAQQRLSTKE
jgi:hypothetical protein